MQDMSPRICFRETKYEIYREHSLLASYIVTPGNTDNTVNKLARKQLHLHRMVSERTKGGINLYTELEKYKLDQI